MSRPSQLFFENVETCGKSRETYKAENTALATFEGAIEAIKHSTAEWMVHVLQLFLLFLQ